MTATTQTPDVLADVALLAIEQVCAAVALRPSRLRELVALGQFPQPIRMGPRYTRWPASAVRQWLVEMSTRKDPAAAQVLAARAARCAAARKAKHST